MSPANKTTSALLLLILAIGAFALAPMRAYAYTCGSGASDEIGGNTRVCRHIVTSGTSWTIPSDWNNASNTIEVIGGGGGGMAGNIVGGGDAGGGGAYARVGNCIWGLHFISNSSRERCT